jgi:hypothetical protein
MSNVIVETKIQNDEKLLRNILLFIRKSDYHLKDLKYHLNIALLLLTRSFLTPIQYIPNTTYKVDPTHYILCISIP